MTILTVNLIISFFYLNSINNLLTSKAKSKTLREHTGASIISSLPTFPVSFITWVVLRTGHALPHFGRGCRPHWPSRVPLVLLDLAHSYLFQESSSVFMTVPLSNPHPPYFLLVLPSTCYVSRLHIARVAGKFYLYFFLPIRLSVPVGASVIFS